MQNIIRTDILQTKHMLSMVNEKCKLKLLCNTLKWLKLSKVTIVNVGKVVEQSELIHCWWEFLVGSTHLLISHEYEQGDCKGSLQHIG